MVLIRNGSTNGDKIYRSDYKDMWTESAKFLKFRDKQEKKLWRLARRNKRRGKLRLVPRRYEEYIKSKHWRRRKEQYFSRYPKKCCICNERSGIELHHIVYGEFGSEKDKHLAAVCHEHHMDFHEQFGAKRDMTEEWLMYIEECKF